MDNIEDIDASEYAASDGKWLNAEFMKLKGLTRSTLRITGCSKGEYKDGTKHLTLHFYGTDKELGLNKTNLRTVISLYGPGTAGWIGKQVVVYVTQTLYEGKMVDCLRIDMQAPVRQIENEPPRRIAATATGGGFTQAPLPQQERQFVTQERPNVTLSTTRAIQQQNDDPLAHDEIPF